MDRGAWKAAVHGVTEGRTRLSDFTFTFHFHALEKEMATHSSVLAWRIPGTGEPGGLPSLGSHRVRHKWSDLAAAAARDLLSLYTNQNSIPLCLRDIIREHNSPSKWENISHWHQARWSPFIKYRYTDTERTYTFCSTISATGQY